MREVRRPGWLLVVATIACILGVLAVMRLWPAG